MSPLGRVDPKKRDFIIIVGGVMLWYRFVHNIYENIK